LLLPLLLLQGIVINLVVAPGPGGKFYREARVVDLSLQQHSKIISLIPNFYAGF
jgi:hypothetical protein